MASFARPSLLRQTLATRSPLLRQNVGVSQAVAFHASAKKQILPPLPQTIQGTMNDPVPVPSPHPSEGSYHWTFERAVCVGLIPLSIAPFAAGSLNPVMDAVLCSLLVAHSHVGFQAAIIDYFRPQRVPKFNSLCNWLLRAFTLTTAVGLYEFETNDVGITEALRRIWNA
ncbi:Succinate dehydrogenase cytochrome b small subunit [Penicillium cosmopolitanum]|uniref:Succinate dehydrogenase [ubiquinone] cytochrome b small subunit n=1 Tax=Penicillium cosmopolitanum TaxID=1131564 RepID=A0A9W9VSC7_9EURO|nr:Succinate dehydrogenase cytochrome b small subunit [Penicillium cosmopolitanum]KAJ5388512.1 Succinate dehydrogenase cytochrome b small subunit [Penicillium cosmopolitanum]